MDFESAQKYLESFVSYEDVLKIPYNERHFDLDRLRNFLAKCGVDYSKLKYVHVAGSKGKGSVSFLVAEYLWRSGVFGTSKIGFRVGLFTSPHIVDVMERIVVNGEMISKWDFVSYIEWLKGVIEADKDGGDSDGGCLTYFELLTVIALKYFVDRDVDYAVLEVGLGGRLDATNIVRPEIAILTTVEKEHTDILGDTIGEILNEKLGIVKKDVPLVVGFQTEEVMDLIKRKVTGDVIFAEDFEEARQLLSFDWQLDLAGRLSLAQQKNAQVAFCALKILLGKSFGKVDFDLFLQIVRNFKLIGRYDVRDIGGKTVVFDMAHTINSVRNLVESLGRDFSGKSLVFLVSIMKGKDISAMLNLIGQVANRVVLTSSHPVRGFSGSDLKVLVKGTSIIEEVCEVEEDCVTAYKNLFKKLKPDEVLVVTGSHFLLGLLSGQFS